MAELNTIKNAWLAIENDLIVGYGEMSDWEGISDWSDVDDIKLSEFAISQGRFPLAMASIATPQVSKFCDAATLTASTGVLSIVAPAAKTGGSGAVTLILTPDTNVAGDVNWVCTSTTTPKYAPASCR